MLDSKVSTTGVTIKTYERACDIKLGSFEFDEAQAELSKPSAMVFVPSFETAAMNGASNVSPALTHHDHVVAGAPLRTNARCFSVLADALESKASFLPPRHRNRRLQSSP